MSEHEPIAARSKTDKCYYCSRKVQHFSALTRPMPKNQKTYDHLVPKSRGGLNVPANRVVACVTCNAEKGMLTEFEYRAALASRKGPLALIKLAITPMIRSAEARLMLVAATVFVFTYRIRSLF